jgi:hypothetical protein
MRLAVVDALSNGKLASGRIASDANDSHFALAVPADKIRLFRRIKSIVLGELFRCSGK